MADEPLSYVLVRWLRQGHTDDRETPLDAYGKRVIHEVIRILPRSEREKVVTADLNRKHLIRLKNLMWQAVGHYSNELDEYASALFERPIRGSWRILAHMTKIGLPHEGPGNPWYWEPMTEAPHYPTSEVISFEFFSSVYLHEVAHGWYYLLLDYKALEKWVRTTDYETPGPNWRRDEEEICWEISRFVCKLLDIPFSEEAIP